MCTNWFMQLEAVLVKCTSQGRYWSIYTPRSLANGTGGIVLPNKDNEIGGSLSISCAEPTTTNYVLSRFINRAFVAHHLVIERSWFTAAIALDESDTGNLKYN